jgi:hypothetical protein
MNWCLDDILTILKEGVPFADIDNVEGNVNDPSYTCVTVRGQVNIPIDKIKSIAITGPDISNFVYNNLPSPIIRNNYHDCYINFSNNWTIRNSCLCIEFSLSLNINSISKLAKELADSNFYSALEAALKD